MQKKILFILLIGIVSILSIQCSKESKQAKNQKSYAVKSQFYYSDSPEQPYRNKSIKEFKVGEKVYMKLDIEITEKKEKYNWLFISIIIGIVIGAIVGIITCIVFPPAAPATGSTAAVVATGMAIITTHVGIPIFIAITSLIGGGIGAGSNIAKDELTKPNLDFVECKLEIPKITHVDVKPVGDRQKERKTPTMDVVSDITTYTMRIKLDDNIVPAKDYGINIESQGVAKGQGYNQWSWEFIFIPNAESGISMELIFDDNIAEEYDRVNTLIFVK